MESCDFGPNGGLLTICYSNSLHRLRLSPNDPAWTRRARRLSSKKWKASLKNWKRLLTRTNLRRKKRYHSYDPVPKIIALLNSTIKNLPVRQSPVAACEGDFSYVVNFISVQNTIARSVTNEFIAKKIIKHRKTTSRTTRDIIQTKRPHTLWRHRWIRLLQTPDSPTLLTG